MKFRHGRKPLRMGLHIGLLLALLLPASQAQPGKSASPALLVGILGGMGPEATINFFGEIVKLTPAQRDQDHIPLLIFNYPQIPDRTEAIRKNDRSIIVPYLVEGVQRLEKAGAAFIAIPCNTVHYFYDDMQKAVSIPIIHMIREAGAEVERRFARGIKVGLLATSGTLATHLYQDELTRRGFSVLTVDGDIQETCVMAAIYGIKSGLDKKKCEDLLAIAGEQLENKGAQLILLGCTEIPLAFNPGRVRVPVVNATRVLAEAVIRLYRERSLIPK